jgi:hypothetical protein
MRVGQAPAAVGVHAQRDSDGRDLPHRLEHRLIRLNPSGVAQLDFERVGMGEFEPVARALLRHLWGVDANRHGGGRNRLAREPQQLPHG